MNDPNRRIDIDKSSLLSLKAELLRKQQEASQKPTRTFEDHVPKKAVKSSKAKTPATTQPTKEVEIEDVSLLNKSRKILEAKAKYYNRMTSSGGALNSDENCLVMFNQKRQAGFGGPPSSSDSSDDDDAGPDNKRYETNDPESEWVEYTDCLGRTRKCLKKDLEDFKKRDQALAAAAELRNSAPDETTFKSPRRHHSDDELEEGEVIGPVPFPPPMPVGETFLQQREKWEEQEVKNLQKDNVHYQDVLFDEAREHGVGYYAFSNEDVERAKQQKELDKIRSATLAAQQRNEEIRKNREKIIAERVKAAKARQRARQGLPPEDETEAETKAEEELYDKTEELERQRKAEKKRLKREAEEKERERQRQAYVRPWDKDKSDGQTADDWIPTREREPMSQEQWNAQKREERNLEFAPVPELGRKRKPRPKTPEPELYSTPPPSMFSVPPPPIPPPFDESAYREENKTLFFSTKKPAFKRKNYVETESFPPHLIHNELGEDDSEPPPPGTSRTRTEVPPPMSYDGDEHKKPRVVAPDIASSIAAGLRFLREQSDKELHATKNTWTANADY